MIVRNPSEITEAVLSEIARAPNPRFQEIMSAAVRHLHDFVREAKLTEREFQQACSYIAKLGQFTNESHNEVVLVAGSLGVSSLVCLLNNGDHGQTETTANLLGPFWRVNSPRTENGASIVRSPTPGDPLFVSVCVRDATGGERGGRRRLACVDGRILREPGPGAGRHEFARQVYDRREWLCPLSKRQAFRLPDSRQRSRRRVAAGARPPQSAARAHSFPDLQAGLQDAVFAGVLE